MSVLHSIDKLLSAIKDLKIENSSSIKHQSPKAQKVRAKMSKNFIAQELKKRRAILRQSRQRVRENMDKSKDYS